MASVTNTYASYATTYEEYQVQRYEGGSTLYGPHTTDAFIQTAVAMATAMVKGEPVVSKVSPPDLEAQQISLFAPVLVDTAAIGEDFGSVLNDAKAGYRRGQEVQVEFR
jgi:neutral ceramidase